MHSQPLIVGYESSVGEEWRCEANPVYGVSLLSMNWLTADFVRSDFKILFAYPS